MVIILGPVVQKPASLTLVKFSNHTFQLLAYGIEHDNSDIDVPIESIESTRFRLICASPHFKSKSVFHLSIFRKGLFARLKWVHLNTQLMTVLISEK